MKRVLVSMVVLLVGACMAFGTCVAGGTPEVSEIQAELEILKSRIEELESKLAAKEKEQKEVAEISTETEEKESKGLLDRFGSLSIHGGVVGYFQGGIVDRIEGEKFENPAGAGFAANLELTFEPIRNGEFYIRIHAGEGEGADKDLVEAGALFANLNTIADDNPGDDGVAFHEVYYTHRFFDNFALSIGKTDGLVFLDDNAFANDELSQFVGKAFVNNPVLDSEDEYAPLVAVNWEPLEALTLTALVQSSSYPLLDEDQQKSKYDNIFDRPFWGVQAKYSPQWRGLEGNYRLYVWSQTYEHPKVEREGTDPGWGIGLSFDQWLHEKVGLFARFGYQNKEVYEVP